MGENNYQESSLLEPADNRASLPKQGKNDLPVPLDWSSQADYKLLFENNHLGVATTNPDLQFIRVNDAFEKMIGYSKAELLNGMTLPQLSPDETAAEASKQLLHKIYTREIDTFEIEKAYQCANGDIMEALTSVTPTYLEDGTLAGCTAFILDITKRRQMERELRAVLKQMKTAQEELVRSEKLASLGALVAGIAHEINTPIGNSLMIASCLKNNADKLDRLMQDPESDVSNFQNLVGKIGKGACLLMKNLGRAGTLITNFKKVAVDRASGNKRTFFLHELIEEITATVKHIAKQRLQIEVDIPCNLKFKSYPGDLGRVFSNLIENALLHGFPNEQNGTLWISAKLLPDQSDCVEIVVRDNGVGMSHQISEKAFDPFFSTKMGTGGSGLGLHIVYGIVTKILGGKFSLKSEIGIGSQFKMIIPLIAKDRAKPEK